MFLEQTKPDTCLISSRADEPLILFCQEYMELTGGQCVLRPQREFVGYKGQEKLQQLRIFSDTPKDYIQYSDASCVTNTVTQNADDFIRPRNDYIGDPSTQRSLTAIRRLNFGGDNAPLCMAATAALLDQLLRVHAASELDETQNHMGVLDIDSIEVMALYMAYSYLSRHAALECFNLPDNVSVSDALSSNLRALCQVPKAMSLLRAGRGRLPEWRAVAKFSYHLMMLKDKICELVGHDNVNVLEQFLEAIDDVSPKDTGLLINTIIDWEESQNTKTICVNPGVDDDLDKKKQTYNGLDDLLIRVARGISRSIPEEFATELQVLYFPQIGFVIRIPRRPEWSSQRDFEQVPDWVHQWKTDDNVFYKSPKMRGVYRLHPLLRIN
ncbi:DNA mismatch repair protein MSH5 [Ceratobasidium sp. AG-Ba]|nr:DNA mismatch repair protein MSH5 [Ceratobasidium sp. AG-Ba]